MMYIWLYTDFSVSSYLLENFASAQKKKKQPSTKQAFFTYSKHGEKLNMKGFKFYQLKHTFTKCFALVACRKQSV